MSHWAYHGCDIAKTARFAQLQAFKRFATLTKNTLQGTNRRWSKKSTTGSQMKKSAVAAQSLNETAEQIKPCIEGCPGPFGKHHEGG